MVLDDVDASLAVLLARHLPDGTTVSFEAPAATWVDAPPGKQVVNAFLYDVREEPDWLGADWEDVRDENGKVIGRQPPPRRYELSYLVTAWAGDAALEHKLLSDVMRMALVREAIPADCLVGSLVEAELPVLLRVVRKNPPQNPASVWSDLALPPRLVLDVSVSAPLVPPMVTDLAPPAEGFHLGVGRGGPGGFRPQGPPGPQRPDASGMPVAKPDQHWRSRMVDEKEDPEDGAAGSSGATDSGATGPRAAGSGPSASGLSGSGAATGEGGPGSAAGAGSGGRTQITVRRRINTTKKD